MRRWGHLFLNLVFMGKLDLFFFLVTIHSLWPLQHINDTSTELTKVHLNPSHSVSSLIEDPKNLSVPDDSF